MILRTVRDVSMLYYDALCLSYGQDLLILSRLNDLETARDVSMVIF